MILTKIPLDVQTIDRLCDEWNEIHRKLGFTILSKEVIQQKTQFIVPLLADERTVGKIIFPRTNLVTELEKKPGECSLIMSKRPGTRLTQVILVNNQYESERKQAQSKQFQEKSKNKRETVLAEFEKKVLCDLEELKKEYKRLNQYMKKLKVLIQIVSSNQVSLAENDLVGRVQNQQDIEEQQ